MEARVSQDGKRRAQPSARLDFLNMPIGRFRGVPISDVPELDFRYSSWLVAQPWFRQRYPDEALALARAIKILPDPEERRRLDERKQRAFKSREAETRARHAQWEEEKADQLARLTKTLADRYAAGPGIMPFGRYRGRLLAEVARDDAYMTYLLWQKASGIPMPSQLRADLEAVQEQIITGKPALASVELHDGGCTVYRPAIWCREATEPSPKSGPLEIPD